MEDHIAKDKILKLLCDIPNESASISDIASKLSIDFYLASYFIGDLIQNDFVDEKDISTKDSHREERQITLNSHGRFFLNQSGGYNKIHRQYRWQNRFIVAKTIANIFNAIAILSIGIWGVYVAMEGNDLKVDNKILHSEVDSLTTELKIFIMQTRQMLDPNNRCITP